MTMNTLTIYTILIFFSITGLNKDDNTPKGLKTGDIAPQFQGTDQFGNIFDLRERLREGPVVMIFYRGHWCKYCNRHLETLHDSIDMITNTGATVITVTPETMEFVEETTEKYDRSFRIISDTNMDIMNKYEVRFSVDDKTLKNYKFRGIDLSEANGENGANLPIPATYIIGMDEKIKYVFFDPDYKNRPSMKTLLQSLKSIND